MGLLCFRRIVVSMIVGAAALPLTAVPASATVGTLSINVDTTLTENHSGSIRIEADDVTLDCGGFSVIGPASASEPGIFAEGRSGVIIKNCDVSGFSEPCVFVCPLGSFGIHLAASTDSQVLNNTTHDNVIGIILRDSHTSLVQGNSSSSDQFGIGMSFFSTGNTFSRNMVTGGDRGIFVTASQDNWIRHNSVDRVSGAGFDMAAATGNVVRNNIVESVIQGFVLRNGSNANRLSENVARDSEDAGFLIDNSSDNRLVRNSSTNQGGAGFRLSASTGNLLRENTSAGGANGFLLIDAASSNTLAENTATGASGAQGGEGNGSGFILLFDSNDNTLRNNAADGNSQGFAVGFTDGNTFKSNSSEDNERSGFAVNQSTATKLKQNSSKQNDIGFLVVGESSDTLLGGNEAEKNRLDGFSIVASSGNRLFGNEAEENGGFGISDDTTGAQTGGTANAYGGNECDDNDSGSSDPSGLCSDG